MERSRFQSRDSISLHPTATHSTVREGDNELCSLFTHIRLVRCVWRLHILTAGLSCLDTLKDRDEISFSVTRFDLASPNCHSALTLYMREIPSYAHYLHAFGWFIACGGSTHLLLDHSTSIHSQIVARSRFKSRDSISCPQLPLSQNTDYRELCSALFTQIWSVHCVWRLHTLGIITKHLDLDADPIG